MAVKKTQADASPDVAEDQLEETTMEVLEEVLVEGYRLPTGADGVMLDSPLVIATDASGVVATPEPTMDQFVRTVIDNQFGG